MATPGAQAKPAEPHEPLRIEIQNDQAVLHLEGVVTVPQAKRLRQLALELAGSGRGVSVQCEKLNYLDCAALQILLALRDALARKSASMTIMNLPESIRETLRTAGLAAAF